jgi:hypothetical protein
METFVIQVRTQTEAATGTSVDELRGVVEHVGSGCRETFTNAGELLAFLHAHHHSAAKEAER